MSARDGNTAISASVDAVGGAAVGGVIGHETGDDNDKK
ncbi:glycine zipper 2TM domain-containing protein [Nitrosomonas sp. Nm58]|nr:hypothetical protein SAMN05421754_105514 [Nitrosomonas sp. Nm58]